MMSTRLFVFLLVAAFFVEEGRAYQVGNDPFRRAERLDPEGKYLLEWEVDWTAKRVTFNVTVETRSWVGFGLSNNETSAAGADMVIGGVDRHGRAYFSDRHILAGSEILILDRQHDYTLHQATEKGHTFLSFSRAFDTCDPEDYAITLNKVTLRWAYGRSDNEDGLNPEKRGIFHTHLLDPDYAPEIIRNRISADPILVTRNRNENVPKETRVWSVQRKLTLPMNPTTYRCAFHKSPRLRKKHHWIGFDIHFPNEESRVRTHHAAFYRCNAPPGLNAKQLFEPALGNPGEACYIYRVPSTDLRFPIQFCSEMYLEWSIGAKTFFMPNHIGVPIGESPDEYYMIQMHYDNPEMRRGIQVEARLDFFYTSQLRPNDGGMLAFIHDGPGLPETLLVPPNSRSHRVFTHCSSECTQRMYPPSGIRIVALTLHSHNAGIGIRMRHFRGNRELPWILFDDNYDNWVQPFRHLRREVTVLPGDQLTTECHMKTNDTSITAGFSTSQEMCNVVLLYYNRVDKHGWCQSGLNSPADRRRILGIENATWVQDELEWIIQRPRRLAGLTLTEFSDRYIDWTAERREELQRVHIEQPHIGRCMKDIYQYSLAEIAVLPSRSSPIGVPWPGPLNTPEEYIGPVSYPFQATPYVPPGSTCRRSRIG